MWSAAYVNSLSVAELREYISRLPDMTEAHYEVLSWLHEEDQVKKGASATSCPLWSA